VSLTCAAPMLLNRVLGPVANNKFYHLT